MNEVIVSVQNLSKHYGEITAASKLNFDIRHGECFGLLGPNGAGKTTTIGMLTGLIDPTTGRVKIDGVDLQTDPLQAKAKIGFVPQDFAFYPTLNAMENLFFFGRIYGLHGRYLRRRAESVLQMAELADCAGRAVSTFSNGMKRRLNIAIGLLHEPQILVLDEPTVGVDTQMRQNILEHIKKFNCDGLSILYSTHYLEEAQRLCHRVAVIDRGEIIALDTPLKLISGLGKGIIRVCFREPISSSHLDRLRQLGPLVNWDPTVAHIQLKKNDAEHVIREVVVSAEREGISIKSLSRLEPTLETVLLHLTGRTSIANDA
jgi:ABC-2 type transport system ATP-binding protein